MSVKKQIPGLLKLCSFYDELPEEFLDEINVDSCFYQNIFDFSLSQQRRVQVSRGSNKKSFAIKLFHFCDLKTQQRYILKEEVNISKRELTRLVDNLRDFFKTFYQASKCIQIPLPKPQVEIGSTKSQDNLFAHYYNDTIEHPNRQIRLSFRFGNNNSSVFSLKMFNLRSNQFIITEIFNLNHREIHHLYKNRQYVAKIVKYLRAITLCREFTPDCGYDNSTIILIGDVHCPNTKCSIRLCRHKKTFQSPGSSDCQCPQCASVSQVRNILFEDQRNSFFLSLCQGVYIFEENQKSVQDVIGDVYCPGKYCSNRENCESLGGYVTTPRSIYAGGKCGTRLFVHEVPFMLQEHVKTTKTDKTRFLFARRR